MAKDIEKDSRDRAIQKRECEKKIQNTKDRVSSAIGRVDRIKDSLSTGHDLSRAIKAKRPKIMLIYKAYLSLPDISATNHLPGYILFLNQEIAEIFPKEIPPGLLPIRGIFNNGLLISRKGKNPISMTIEDFLKIIHFILYHRKDKALHIVEIFKDIARIYRSLRDNTSDRNMNFFSHFVRILWGNLIHFFISLPDFRMKYETNPGGIA